MPGKPGNGVPAERHKEQTECFFMQIKIFTIPLHAGEEATNELNKFLASHRIVDVQQEMVADRCWTFCVRYLLSAPGETSGSGQRTYSSTKKDYKQELNETEFARFCGLREARKKIANEDAIPAYAVFTDAELAMMSRVENLTAAEMIKINGIGKARAEHYGTRIIGMMEQEGKNEAAQPLV